MNTNLIMNELIKYLEECEQGMRRGANLFIRREWSDKAAGAVEFAARLPEAPTNDIYGIWFEEWCDRLRSLEYDS